MFKGFQLQYKVNHEVLQTHEQDKLPFIAKWNQLEALIEKLLSGKNKNQNAIDSLLQVSRMLANHRELHYTNFDGNPEELRKIYNQDLEKRVHFAYEKIGLNFELGQKQNVYRHDISREFVSRSYAKRMLDLHNPRIYPPRSLSYETLYHFMFEDFLLGIANQNGLRYFRKSYQLA